MLEKKKTHLLGRRRRTSGVDENRYEADGAKVSQPRTDKAPDQPGGTGERLQRAAPDDHDSHC